MRIGVLNGPNLNLLGTREPTVYGTTTLAQIDAELQAIAREIDVELVSVQKNGEGELIDVLHGWQHSVQGILVNAGAYTHTSLALRDALSGIAIPFVEVHLSNIYAREPERRHSMLASAAVGMITGLGAAGYGLALRGLVARLRAA